VIFARPNRLRLQARYQAIQLFVGMPVEGQPAITSRAPQPDGSAPVALYVYVEDVDKTIERAVAAGAKILMPVADQFWGDRIGWIMDPAGHAWTVATRIEETTEKERQARLFRLMAGSIPTARVRITSTSRRSLTRRRVYTNASEATQVSAMYSRAAARLEISRECWSEARRP
jgi:hypothetical protein